MGPYFPPRFDGIVLFQIIRALTAGPLCARPAAIKLWSGTDGMPNGNSTNRPASNGNPPNSPSTGAGQARKRKRRFRRTVLLGIFVAVVGGLIAANWQLLTGTLETRLIAATRAKYRALWAIGRPLPGTPDLQALAKRLADGGFTLAQPILIRIYKREFELEIWKARDGRFHHFATYPICRWAGRLGPKLKQGDRQSPEGFYTVGKGQLNPASRWAPLVQPGLSKPL